MSTLTLPSKLEQISVHYMQQNMVILCDFNVFILLLNTCIGHLLIHLLASINCQNRIACYFLSSFFYLIIYFWYQFVGAIDIRINVNSLYCLHSENISASMPYIFKLSLLPKRELLVFS